MHATVVATQELKNMDADVIFSKQLKQIEKEKKDKEVKLKTQEKKVSMCNQGREQGRAHTLRLRWTISSVLSVLLSCSRT